MSCIDALSRVRYDGYSGKRFKRFARENLMSFSPPLADRLYEDFRNGLCSRSTGQERGPVLARH